MKNIMGSEVVEGYKCKPIKLDINKPIMEHCAILYICCDKRCSSVSTKNKADELRAIIKQLGLHTGKNRIKISTSFCQGVCRFRQVGVIYDKTGTNNNTWIKQIEQISKQEWIKIFLDIANDTYLQNIKKIDKKVY